jgi:hypothetical protein
MTAEEIIRVIYETDREDYEDGEQCNYCLGVDKKHDPDCLWLEIKRIAEGKQ